MIFILFCILVHISVVNSFHHPVSELTKSNIAKISVDNRRRNVNFSFIRHSSSNIIARKSSNQDSDNENQSSNNNIQLEMAATLENQQTLPGQSKNENNLLNNKLLNVFSSAALALGIFVFQNFQPASSVVLLKAMEKESPPLEKILCNGKPTIVDFYADWCENCKVMAPTVRQLQYNYKNDINFVTIDGSDPKNSKLVEMFRVDGIPHFAFVTESAELKTALIGTVPKSILNSEMKALAEKRELPYQGYNAFGPDESHILFPDITKQCIITSKS